MLRPLLKLMDFIFVTLTIIVSVIDSANSVSTSHRMPPSIKLLVNFLQTNIYSFNQSIRNTMPSFLSSTCITLTYLPIWSIFGALAIIFCLLDHASKKPFRKISYTQKYI
ncbi:hypothetical protein [Bartonella refiksaydamii]|uniref:hypothetical protein n=1 Tax=Bartonella refiksaydamii TaxID=2654951 RepID=UPI0012EC4E8D